MNRNERRHLRKMFAGGERALARQLRGKPLQQQFGICNLYASIRMAGPFNAEERALSDQLVSRAMPCDWFHGGVGGLGAGGVLLPASETGADPRGEGRVVSDRFGRVFFTPYLDLAQQYAAKVKAGAVYRVAPQGPIEADPADLRMMILIDRHIMPVTDILGDMLEAVGFCASRAAILEVLK